LFGSAQAAGRGSTSKKVVAVRFDRKPLRGFIDPQSSLQTDGIELLTAAGAIAKLPYREVKALCFVRDFDSGPVWKENRVFTVRPKTEGVWVRLLFEDGDTMEGVIPNNLLAVEPHGFTIAAPDPGFQNQRIFVPRQALRQVQVVGVIGSPLRKRRKPPDKAGKKDQLEMFD
jgi:hypothetical protein